MKKNMMMRIASVLLVAVLLSTCAISGTFAKYTSSAKGNDSARVAYWGWNQSNELALTGLFTTSYGTTDINSADGTDVIAPGASGEATFQYAYKDYNETIKAPEVDYTFTITVIESCDDLIKNNANIRWYLDDETAPLTWDELVTKIVQLAGNSTPTTPVTRSGNTSSTTIKYEAGSVPAAFAENKQHTITWVWDFEDAQNENAAMYVVNDEGVTVYLENAPTGAWTQDEYDTYMGNAADLADCSITIEIVITQTTGETTAPETTAPENTVEPSGN